MIDALLPALEVMVEGAESMAEEVDRDLWGGLARRLDHAHTRLAEARDLLGDTHGDLPSPAPPALTAIQRWAQAVIDDEAGHTPATTAHLASILRDLTAALQIGLTRTNRDSALHRLSMAALRTILAAGEPVVAGDADARLPEDVVGGDHTCDQELCWRDDGISNVIVWEQTGADGRGWGMWQRRCPDHRR